MAHPHDQCVRDHQDEQDQKHESQDSQPTVPQTGERVCHTQQGRGGSDRRERQRGITPCGNDAAPTLR